MWVYMCYARLFAFQDYLHFVLLPGIEDLCAKRDELHKVILEEEEEKRKIQNDVRILTERLAKINQSLSNKVASRNEFDKTIAETEAAYMKVLIVDVLVVVCFTILLLLHSHKVVS